MAGQWNVEVAEGSDICEENVPLNSVQCDKNPGHREFIEFGKLKLHHLPETFRKEEMLNGIKEFGKKVVRLRIEKKESAPGFIVHNDKYSYHIQTNTTLIKTKQDVKNCSITIHIPDSDDVITCRGDKLITTNLRRTKITFHPIPDFLPAEMTKHKERKEKMEVRLEITKTKTGTGFVMVRDNTFYVETNNHVVKTEEEVKNCIVEFNYNSFNSPDLVVCRGQDLRLTCETRDITSFTFNPVPEFLSARLKPENAIPSLVVVYNNGRIKEYYVDFTVFTESQKVQYITNFTGLNNSDILHAKITYGDGTESELASRYMTFYPVPKNIQSFTHQMTGYHHPLIKLEQEDDDHKTIPGKLVYSFDRPVFELQKPLTREEARKCTIYFPNGVISNGMGIYFELKDSRQLLGRMYSGVDLEASMKSYSSKACLIHIKPPPRFDKLMDNEASKTVLDFLQSPDTDVLTSGVGSLQDMCAIGHPHGGIKMVSFGFKLEDSSERFNENGDMVTNSEEGQEVICINYTCPTCPGSSGSPVIHLILLHDGDAPNYTHFLGRQNEGDGTNNINTAWCSSRYNKLDTTSVSGVEMK